MERGAGTEGAGINWPAVRITEASEWSGMFTKARHYTRKAVDKQQNL